MLDVIFAIPNLITSFRLILLLIAGAVFNFYPLTAYGIYIVSTLLDLVDGPVSRKLNQTSFYGGVMDYVVDRMDTLLLIVFLSMQLKSYFMVFVLILFLDNGSHLLRLYSTLYSGKNYHKDIKSQYALLNAYYAPSRGFMIFCVTSYQVFLCTLGVGHIVGFEPTSIFHFSYFYYPLLLLSFPGFVCKNLIHGYQLLDSGVILATKGFVDPHSLTSTESSVTVTEANLQG